MTEINQVHTWTHEHSILSLATKGNKLFAGTERGDILVFDLDTYQQICAIAGHQGSVYCLRVVSTEDIDLLVSGGSDSILKIWKICDSLPCLIELYTVYSVYDIGDIFCVENIQQVVFVGAQNATIQWFEVMSLTEPMLLSSNVPGRIPITSSNSVQNLPPSERFDKFFDSAGPGGKLNEAQKRRQNQKKQQLLEIPPTNYIKFAHNGYVYAMTVFNGATLVSGGGDGTVKFWQLNKDRSRLNLLRVVELEDSVLSLTHPANTALIYCGLDSGRVALYDTDVCQVVRVGMSVNEEGRQDGLKEAPKDADEERSSVELSEENFAGITISSSSTGTPAITMCSANERCVIQSAGEWVERWEGGRKSPLKWKAHNGLILASTTLKTHGYEQLLITAGNDARIAVWDISEFSCEKGNGLERSKSAVGRNGFLDDDAMIRSLKRFVSYRTVSNNGGQETHWDEFHKCTKFLRDLLTKLGAETRLYGVEKPGHPIVYGCFRANAEKSERKNTRVLFYGHYDVISAADSTEWTMPPFEMNAKDGYLYGRGVSDNKGPTLAAIFAVGALYAQEQLTNDVVFLVEGQEECGSPGFRQAIESHREEIGNIDWIILSNSYWLNDLTPCLNYGLRGVVNVRLKVSSGGPDLHSGVHGGVSREPSLDLIQLLSSITNKNQEVQVQGFYDDVRQVTADEAKLYEAITRTGVVEASTDHLMRQWRYPSITLHGIESSGPHNTTVIPASVEAAISFRIVPDQTCDKIKHLVQAFVQDQFAQLNTNNKLEMEFGYEAEPWLGHPTNKAFQTLRQAMTKEWGREPLFTREGGSIPVVRVLEDVFGAPAAQLPCGQASDAAHLINERLRVTNFFATRRILESTFNSLETDGHGSHSNNNK